MSSWPEKVGILAMELIIPSTYVDQTELEEYDQVSPGKYTIGLGQERMGFCTDREDINSICLTVVQNLIEKHGIKYTDIGHLEVGTETLVDKSKSVKTVLMQLFEPHGATDIEGIDTTNACYGGTAALFNAIAWIESSAWDGRYALVVAADIAIYAEGTARPTGGAGAVAMLLGPNAPLVFDRGLRASYMKHAWDFYKPDMSSEYPVVDGKLSIQCYLNALDQCYQLYCKKASKLHNSHVQLDFFDNFIFHSPFGKLVQKSVGRLRLNDYLKYPSLRSNCTMNLSNVSLENSYFDKDLEKEFLIISKDMYKSRTEPSLHVAKRVGNMYTASLYGGLVSLLVSKDITQLAGNRVALFSYGSGLASSMYSLTISDDLSPDSSLRKLISKLSDVLPRLEQRKRISPEKFASILKLREQTCHTAPYIPKSDIDNLFPGTYYLSNVDDNHRRFYSRTPIASNNNCL